jgi:hypothetical protein
VLRLRRQRFGEAQGVAGTAISAEICYLIAMTEDVKSPRYLAS